MSSQGNTIIIIMPSIHKKYFPIPFYAFAGSGEDNFAMFNPLALNKRPAKFLIFLSPPSQKQNFQKNPSADREVKSRQRIYLQ